MANERTSSPESPAGNDDDDEEGYVHQPRSSPPPRQARPTDADFGWHGWLLVGVILVAFFVVPVAILALPRAQSLVGSLGLTLRDAYLVLPLVPAFLLGTVAVWAAVRARSR